MQLEFIGAAQTVTGSMHLLRTSAGAVMLDCGLYQGRRQEAYERNRDLDVPLGEVRAVVLSHAHIDHSGALPLLAKRGFRGHIYATPATRSLCTVMLRDAAAIQAADARHLARQRLRAHGPPSSDGPDGDIVPLYASRCFPGGHGQGGRAPQVVLVHGDIQPQRVLAAKLAAASLPGAAIPASGDRIEIR